MVDAALSATRAVQCRLRDLPSRVVVYLALASCLFPETGYPGVWRKLTGALACLPVVSPTASALAQAHRRVGSKPLRWLFDLLRGSAVTGHGPEVRWHGLLVVALDGTPLTAPDTPAVKQTGNHGGTGYPQLRLLALVACGTRTLIDAVLALPKASTRRSTPCWSSTSCCRPPWRTPPAPGRGPIRTGPASASPGRPPATWSSRPRASSPTPSSTSPAPSADTSWPACCPSGDCASAPASSNAPSPSTRPEVPASTGPATKPPPASKFSHPADP
ncbi:transposase domain-containing protein [Streptomyces hygroscopicus]|uniref:transposase domain-containing protein n=1 Tax=Streptomyces hygroscopicus TaxID=1912 RepID=UPI002030D991|nr:transposase domain-containing protein [Streptomyces hygroscopicus]